MNNDRNYSNTYNFRINSSLFIPFFLSPFNASYSFLFGLFHFECFIFFFFVRLPTCSQERTELLTLESTVMYNFKERFFLKINYSVHWYLSIMKTKQVPQWLALHLLKLWLRVLASYNYCWNSNLPFYQQP